MSNMPENWKEILGNKTQALADQDVEWFAEHDEKACFEASEEFKKGYDVAKLFYASLAKKRGTYLIHERFFKEIFLKDLKDE